MFKCEKCELLSDLLEKERARSKELQDELMGFVRQKLYKPYIPSNSDSSEYYGNDDEMVAYNEFGDKVVYKVGKDEKQ